jgi:hypothetical protein
MNSHPLLARLSPRSVNRLIVWAYAYAVRHPDELSADAWQGLPYYTGTRYR